MFVSSMKHDLISGYISGNEERYPLNMVIVKMRKETAKSFPGAPLDSIISLPNTRKPDPPSKIR